MLCFFIALPVIIQLVSTYLKNNLPSLSKTTPLFIGQNISTATTGDTDMTSETMTTPFLPFSRTTGVYRRRIYKTTPYQYFKNYYNFGNVTTTPYTYTSRSYRNRRQRPTVPPSSMDYQSTDISEEIRSSDEDYYDENGDTNNLVLSRQNGIYGDGKSSTRGDIPGNVTEEISTTTSTTPMPTEAATEEDLEKFLTQIVTIVTMVSSFTEKKVFN